MRASARRLAVISRRDSRVIGSYDASSERSSDMENEVVEECEQRLFR